ncbi:small, acid-soluble spore protein, alpha/beta type [Proteiniborus sp.]|uniref:small, acid-soluble spore protein, alpha/beta type n=1 Tax=Proteiniborus sp. TaxID=2079015 RepID=UPI003329F5FA
MKDKKISPNARQAFQSFKEELAKDMEVDLRDRDDHITKMMENETSDKYTHLGRS